jgi:hypothetical protein
MCDIGYLSFSVPREWDDPKVAPDDKSRTSGTQESGVKRIP